MHSEDPVMAISSAPRLRRAVSPLAAAVLVIGCAGSGTSSPSPAATPAGSVPSASAPITATPRAEPVAIRYSFDWTPDSDWAPVVWADELGYFAEEGVEVDYGPGDPTLIEQLATQQIDIAQVPGPQAVQAYAEDLPITVVGVQLPESPLVILADADKGITEPADLEGKTVAVQVGEFEGSVWEAWALANDLDRSTIEEVPAGGTADVLFIDHQVDAFMDFYTSGAMVELTDGREGEETLFLVSDTLDIIGQSQAVHNDFLAEHPEAVAGFLRAWARGAEYAIGHRDETVDLILETFPELEEAGVEWSTDKYFDFWTSEQPMSGGLLSFTPEMWESTKQMLVDAALIEDLDVSELYTTEYLPDPPIIPPEPAG
jgi:NitT/TauT family transport system substrate-binding protein